MKSGWQKEMATLGKGNKYFPPCLALLCALVLGGCLSDRGSVGKKLMAEYRKPGEAWEAARAYRVYCPDVIEVRVMNRPDLHWHVAVDVDGTLPVEYLARPRVEGRNVEEISKLVAARLGVSEQNIVAKVAEFNSKQIYLFGQVQGAQQAIPYRGPETVLEVLQRVGGITTGADAREVFVVRSNIMEGKRPEVFHVDLHAILMKQDHTTNLRLQPFDQIHVGETKQALVERCIPPWMRPFHWVIWDTRPDSKPLRHHLQNRLQETRQAIMGIPSEQR